MFRVSWLIFLLPALLAGCATTPQSPAASAPYHDTLIVPKKRIGPALLGMSAEQMVQWLGRPDQAVGSGDGAYRYSGAGIQVAFDGERAYAVSVTKPGFATADGIAVGSSAAQLARWGEPTETRDATRCAGKNCESRLGIRHHCFANGVGVDVDAGTGLIAGVEIHAGGCHQP